MCDIMLEWEEWSTMIKVWENEEGEQNYIIIRKEDGVSDRKIIKK
jgi:hypothetical protein